MTPDEVYGSPLWLALLKLLLFLSNLGENLTAVYLLDTSQFGFRNLYLVFFGVDVLTGLTMIVLRNWTGFGVVGVMLECLQTSLLIVLSTRSPAAYASFPVFLVLQLTLHLIIWHNEKSDKPYPRKAIQVGGVIIVVASFIPFLYVWFDSQSFFSTLLMETVFTLALSCYATFLTWATVPNISEECLSLGQDVKEAKKEAGEFTRLSKMVFPSNDNTTATQSGTQRENNSGSRTTSANGQGDVFAECAVFCCVFLIAIWVWLKLLEACFHAYRMAWLVSRCLCEKVSKQSIFWEFWNLFGFTLLCGPMMVMPFVLLGDTGYTPSSYESFVTAITAILGIVIVPASGLVLFNVLRRTFSSPCHHERTVEIKALETVTSDAHLTSHTSSASLTERSGHSRSSTVSVSHVVSVPIRDQSADGARENGDSDDEDDKEEESQQPLRGLELNTLQKEHAAHSVVPMTVSHLQ